jgi:ABC-type uncharacterized transport system permease subunit
MTWGAIAISVLASLGFITALVIAYISHDTTSQSLLVGAIISNFSTAVSFWLGSSMGSQKKDERIDQLTSAPKDKTI